MPGPLPRRVEMFRKGTLLHFPAGDSRGRDRGPSPRRMRFPPLGSDFSNFEERDRGVFAHGVELLGSVKG